MFHSAQGSTIYIERQPSGPAMEAYSSLELPSSTDELCLAEYSTDDFRMFAFKVMKCSKRYVHDWRSCPFAHPTENARRRDPRQYRYMPLPCPDYKRGICLQGDGCPYSHGVYECWLHPAKYRTQLCKDGAACRRPVCFFAHSVSQLRTPTYAYEQTAHGLVPVDHSGSGNMTGPSTPAQSQHQPYSQLGSPGSDGASTPFQQPQTPVGAHGMGFPGQPPSPAAMHAHHQGQQQRYFSSYTTTPEKLGGSDTTSPRTPHSMQQSMQQGMQQGMGLPKSSIGSPFELPNTVAAFTADQANMKLPWEQQAPQPPQQQHQQHDTRRSLDERMLANLQQHRMLQQAAAAKLQRYPSDVSAAAGIIAASPETGPRMSNAVARSLGLAPPKDLPGARARTLGTLGALTGGLERAKSQTQSNMANMLHTASLPSQLPDPDHQMQELYAAAQLAAAQQLQLQQQQQACQQQHSHSQPSTPSSRIRRMSSARSGLITAAAQQAQLTALLSTLGAAGMQTPPSPQSQQQAAAAVAQADPAAVAELLTSLQKLGFSITPPGSSSTQPDGNMSLCTLPGPYRSSSPLGSDELLTSPAQLAAAAAAALTPTTTAASAYATVTNPNNSPTDQAAAINALSNAMASHVRSRSSSSVMPSAMKPPARAGHARSQSGNVSFRDTGSPPAQGAHAQRLNLSPLGRPPVSTPATTSPFGSVNLDLPIFEISSNGSPNKTVSAMRSKSGPIGPPSRKSQTLTDILAEKGSASDGERDDQTASIDSNKENGGRRGGLKGRNSLDQRVERFAVTFTLPATEAAAAYKNKMAVGVSG